MQENTNLNNKVIDSTTIANLSVQAEKSPSGNVLVPTSNLAGQVTQNKNILYVKILAFVFIFLILLVVIFYFLSSNKSVVTLPKGNNSFPAINLGNDRPGETYVAENNLEEGNEGTLSEGDIDNITSLWPKSIAGGNIINIKTGTTTENYILFMDKESGNIYKTNYPTLESVKLTNTTLQDINKAAFSKNADFVSVLKGSGPYYKLISSRLSSEVNSSFSESEIDEMVYDLTSSKTENIFYYLKKEEGGTTSIKSFSPVAGKVTKLSEIKVLDVIISGENKNSLFVSSKPTSKAKQLSVVLNKKNNTLEYISSSDNNKYTLGGGVIKELAGTASFSDIENYKRNSSLSIKSFADKCSDVYGKYLVCGEDEIFSDEFRILDYWYSGKVSFTDSLSFLDLFNGEKTTIPASLISGEPLDIYSINVGEGFLTFKNKNDESLWLVDLAGL